MAQDRTHARIVAEKPFGTDLASAKKLNAELTSAFEESQIYRIDHYLGKETVQNMLAFRFANYLFEPIWNRRYIDHVQITVAETVGVEERAGYYERSGALRDMVQNHLMQLVCLVAMEPPISYAADEVRDKKVEVLRAIRPIGRDQVARQVVRGQYGAGTIDGKPVPAYRKEPGVDPKSATETFVAAKLFVDELALAGRALLPADRQTAVRPRFSDCHSVSPRAAPLIPSSRCKELAAQSPGNRYPAPRNHPTPVPGEGAGADHAPFAGPDGIQLPRSIPNSGAGSV